MIAVGAINLPSDGHDCLGRSGCRWWLRTLMAMDEPTHIAAQAVAGVIAELIWIRKARPGIALVVRSWINGASVVGLVVIAQPGRIHHNA